MYEQNLEALRIKRIKRKGIKSTGYGGARRIFFIFERATRKYPGDLKLWMQYLEFIKTQKAHKRMGNVLTQLLRLHPTNADIWIYAAEYAADRQGEITTARGYVQRGLRFCPQARPLWLAFLRLEMAFVQSKMNTLRVLGVKPSAEDTKVVKSLEDEGADEQIGAPTLGPEDINPAASMDDDVDQVALANMAKTPALSGDIPIAIFDTAMKEFKGSASMAESMFDVVYEFNVHQLPCTIKVLRHMIHYLEQQTPVPYQVAVCNFKLLFLGISVSSPKFPAALRDGLQTIRSGVQQQSSPDKKAQLAERVVYRLTAFAVDDDVDIEVRHVVTKAINEALKLIKADSHLASVIKGMTEMMSEKGIRIIQSSVPIFNEQLGSLQKHSTPTNVDKPGG